MAEKKYRNFKQIVNALYREEADLEELKIESEKQEEKEVRIEPKLVYDKLSKDLKVEFRIGKSKLYKIKDLTDFYLAMLAQEKCQYGNKFEFVHRLENFEKTSRPLVQFILKYAELMKYVDDNGVIGYRYCGKILDSSAIVLTPTGMDEFFSLMLEKKVLFKEERKEIKIEIQPTEPEVLFEMEELDSSEYRLHPTVKNYEYYLFSGRKYEYLLLDNQLYFCGKEFIESIWKIIEIFRKNFTKEIIFSKKELPEFFSFIVPKIKKNLVYKNVEQEKLEPYIPQELGVKVFLDIDKNHYVIVQVTFCYGDKEFNPLDLTEHIEIARDLIKETKAFNLFRKTGFLFDETNARFVLTQEDKIYEFLSQDIKEYMNRFEVLATDEFKKREIYRPKLSEIGVRVESNLLTIDVSHLSFDKRELKEILEKYKLKKKYHQLKNGSFIDLEENEEIAFLEDLKTGLDIEDQELESGMIQVPLYRSLYLNRILEKMPGVELKTDKGYRQLVNQISYQYKQEDIPIPESLEDTLRYYQKTGYKWLKTLEEYQLGGILADDMGLRKDSSDFNFTTFLLSK